MEEAHCHFEFDTSAPPKKKKEKLKIPTAAATIESNKGQLNNNGYK